MAAGKGSGTRQVLLVTGGSRGIGAAIVREAVAAGYDVCFSFRSDREAAETLAASFPTGAGRAHAVRGDVADPGFARAFFEEATGHFGEPTAVVNNAGITGRIGRFADLPVEVLRQTLEVNVIGTMLLSQMAVRRWEAIGQTGNIVNISSVASTLGAPSEYVHYAASKAAIEGFTIGLGKEVAASGIRVNTVAPGTTLTDIHAAGGDPDRPQRVAANIPLGRCADPEEIARCVLWLLSAEASYVTATVLRVGGGL
ncbi:NAD(P)-dependent dehydrogenase (short-subunit alcohol dehydrogenase family) [Pseudorhizobium tarimense]|uniref:NAD(P)-dependent dehydrogenase (Short-subunit alcohol dehydrogenase family) n=1 Tax=Pseudorhizobium tarimense TaxID=1079109 RepID=A0ABV2HDY1_9HYPH|nr:SDR family oxidoreductase [Pseudorhizobium tarimense]MCJ8521613.1 SDR family oxidoreductase [Pseudorhizobium tarimense]